MCVCVCVCVCVLEPTQPSYYDPLFVCFNLSVKHTGFHVVCNTLVAKPTTHTEVHEATKKPYHTFVLLFIYLQLLKESMCTDPADFPVSFHLPVLPILLSASPESHTTCSSLSLSLSPLRVRDREFLLLSHSASSVLHELRRNAIHSQ